MDRRMAVNGTYGGGGTDKGANNKNDSTDIDYATDPASGGFFNSDYKKHDDLKQMLDINKDSLKLEAMKRVISMIAKGKDASDLFPSVVKNVVSKNIEVKKLVYVYLVRYAEEQQDLALLSISTFQRALKDPNQLIRGSALRVLSSIRVSMIVPIVMLAIKDAAQDMSPYVRKTAAHAIPKLYNLDPDQKEELILVIDKLLSDRATLVVGSAVMAFEEVCPDRIDLIHKNYRKLFNLLADVDEWGQVIIVNMLTRYGRTQFIDPNLHIVESDGNKPFLSDSNDSESDDDKNEEKKDTYLMDPDHRLLLRTTRPLLQSRNAAVVMSVAQLYHHLAPKSDVSIVAKSLIRLLRSHREVQAIVLNSIASISILRKDIFEPYLKSFFVRTNDPTHIKILKLEILTNLATEANISVILREFQTYISSTDKQFVAATVHAIGRCASNIKEVRDSCLNGLVSMLSNRDETVVAESVVVMKKLLQTHPNSHIDIITHMAKLVDNITVPQARASILWLLGEYSYLVPKIAPDVLRKTAKTFINEEDIVKLQILNLAVKLILTNEDQTKLLCQYVLTLARYDQNYDIRDRSRLLRQILFPQKEDSILTKHAKSIFLATKPAPLLQSKFIDREEFQMGSLSHYINARANGYHDLPPFPDTPPDSSVRNVAVPDPVTPPSVKKQTTLKKKSNFYSDSENSSLPAEESESEENSEKASDDETAEDSEIGEEYSDSSEHSEPKSKIDIRNKSKSTKKKSEDEESTSEEESESDEDDDESDESDPEPKKKELIKEQHQSTKKPSNIDLLLELDDDNSQIHTVPNLMPTSTLSAMLAPVSHIPIISTSSINVTTPSYVPNTATELVNKMNTSGQLSVQMKFTRSQFLYSDQMVSIELTFCNHSSDELTNIKMGHKDYSSGISVHEFEPISILRRTEQKNCNFGINFNDSTKPVDIEILWTTNETTSNKILATIRVPIGELIRPIIVSEIFFKEEQNKLKGMNEHKANVTVKIDDVSKIVRLVYQIVNFGPVVCDSEDPTVYRCAGQTLSSKSLVLFTIIKTDDSSSDITAIVNCEKMVVGSMILTEVKNHLLKFI